MRAACARWLRPTRIIPFGTSTGALARVACVPTPVLWPALWFRSRLHVVHVGRLPFAVQPAHARPCQPAPQRQHPAGMLMRSGHVMQGGRAGGHRMMASGSWHFWPCLVVVGLAVAFSAVHHHYILYLYMIHLFTYTSIGQGRYYSLGVLPDVLDGCVPWGGHMEHSVCSPHRCCKGWRSTACPHGQGHHSSQHLTDLGM